MPDKDRIRFYRGRSMWGTFRAGDLLNFEPVRLPDVRPGDVVIFRASGLPEESEGLESIKELVHRVVALAPEGLVTRGDSNREADAEAVTEGALVGRVVSFVRGGRTRPVRGGRRGLAHARHLRLRNALWAAFKSVGRKPYGLLRVSGLAPRLWRPDLKRISFSTEQGPQVKYVHRGRTVAVWWPGLPRFECLKPYDLLFRVDDGEPRLRYRLPSGE
jgi:hypothetical protein